MSIKEYVVTLWSHEELDGFYQDMENTCEEKDEIPTRACTCTNRHPINRHTDYELDDTEIEQLIQDKRVRDITPKDVILNAVAKPRGYTQTSSDWSRSNTVGQDMKNWGLPRCINGSTAGWGRDGTASITATINTTNTGANVDVVVVDGHIDPDHPEFSQFADGTGSTRVVQFNWLNLNPFIDGSAVGTYVYPSGAALDNDQDNHGQHVAGTIAGNTQGWARDATIYNISPYSNNPNTLVGSVYDYVRVFHEQKAPDPETGLKRPTIMNNSWGISIGEPLVADVDLIQYRGTDYSGPFTTTDLENYGLVDQFNDGVDDFVSVEFWSPVYESDLEDAINSGVITVGAAGNGRMRLATDGDADYDNEVRWSAGNNAGIRFRYHRGSTNVTGANAVVVGAASSLVNDSKATFSATGPRVDIYAPGESIMSAIHSGAVTVADPRDSNYLLTKQQGTSMASPQVAGLLACWLEQNPRANQADAVSYLAQHAAVDEMTVTTGSYTDNTSLQNGSNSYLSYYYDRPLNTGMMLPRKATGARPASGTVYPRPKTVFA